MIIVKSPLRITLGGGGTDLPGWYSQHGGFLISAAINKYIYLTGSNRKFDKTIWLSYSKVEICDSIEEISHDIIAKVLKKYNINNGLEIHSISEVSGGSGLGSSGTFTVGLLHLLNTMFKKDMKRKEIAEAAAYVEMVELKKHCGKQDQYIAAYGGVATLNIDQEGEVVVKPLELDQNTLITLQNNLHIYHTGVARDANDILKDQNTKLKKKQQAPTSGMMRIQEIGYEAQQYISSGNLEAFGKSLNEHWDVKKSISKKMSSTIIDDLYDYAIKCGALGGKIMGAGGGGYFMFYVPAERHMSFRDKMQEEGLFEMNWQFDFNGVNTIYAD
jgi:D-glycero-alpha-D-manno-heptose-7-phosphate kinase